MKYMNSDNAESISMEAIARVKMDCGLMLQGSYAYVHEKKNIKDTIYP